MRQRAPGSGHFASSRATMAAKSFTDLSLAEAPSSRTASAWQGQPHQRSWSRQNICTYTSEDSLAHESRALF